MSEGHSETSVQLRNGIKGQHCKPFTSPPMQGGVVCNTQIEFEGQGQPYGKEWSYVFFFLGLKKKILSCFLRMLNNYILTESTVSR